MATLYIAEYATMGIAISGVAAQAPQEPPVAEQTVVYSGSTQSSAFNAQTRFVRLHTDSICSIAFGSNPTAATTNKRLAANQTEYFGVIPGMLVAAITNT